MVSLHGANTKFSSGPGQGERVPWDDFVKENLDRTIPQADWPIRTADGGFQLLLEAGTLAGRTVEMDFCAQRYAQRVQARNVVDVDMADEDIQPRGSREPLRQVGQPAARVEAKNPAAPVRGDAGRVSAVFQELPVRRRQGATRSPPRWIV